MATLREIRTRIVGVKNTAKITSAMKMVSAAKLKRSQDAIELARPYFQKFQEVLSNVAGNVGENYQHPITDKRTTVNNVAVIVVGSDRGLCGGFNTQIIKYANVFIESEIKKEFPNAKIKIVPIGKKTTSFYAKSDYEVITSFPGIFTKLEFSIAKDIIATVMGKYINGEIDRVFIINNEFINVIKQLPANNQILPFVNKNAAEVKSSTAVDYIFEPGQAQILDSLLPQVVDLVMWRALLESAAAENAARMMAMDNATTNARDLINSLNLIYNRERQAAITKEMLEIVGGAEALSKA